MSEDEEQNGETDGFQEESSYMDDHGMGRRSGDKYRPATASNTTTSASGS